MAMRGMSGVGPLDFIIALALGAVVGGITFAVVSMKK